ncbi:MAG TPA: hypothetical protein P5513_05445 [Candidatus Diapherotrites archaeon]|nr:hypothetical protein [Candidatus Diapherotrites archaeon]
MDYSNTYQKYQEKQEKLDALLALHELLISAFHNAVYLQNFGIDNVRIINKINEAIKEVNNLIYEVENEDLDKE